MEPRDGALFPAAAEAFRQALKEPTCRGAVFFAVCRHASSTSLVRLEPGFTIFESWVYYRAQPSAVPDTKRRFRIFGMPYEPEESCGEEVLER